MSTDQPKACSTCVYGHAPAIGSPCGLCSSAFSKYTPAAMPKTPPGMSVDAAWAVLPHNLQCHPGVKALYRAAKGEAA